MICLFFIIASILAWRSGMVLQPKQHEILYERVPAEGLQFALELSLVSQGELGYCVTHPTDITKSDRGFKILTTGNMTARYTGKGDYKIELVNSGSEPIFINMTTYVDREHVADDDKENIKEIVKNLRIELKNIYDWNMKLKDMKEVNIRTIKKIKKWCTLLCLVPICYVLIGVVKHRAMKNLFANRK
ncbi:hypothetical protein TCON_2260 [Astathelohania contejeani]|uniref:GOLD domain-containing protein n=1 Tax=Astathelohania contejeani TaxID=164912 RepID=A0ABQ7HWI4_9MICR|nr:hypothetical protein TCON_2260 [Thelohania contejeani]